jgi:hypothetical protein
MKSKKIRVNKAVFPGLMFLITGLWIAISCQPKQAESRIQNPDAVFSASQKQELLRQIVRKIAKPPEALYKTDETEAYYKQQTDLHQWHFVAADGNRYYYFVSRPAPSLYKKRVGLSGVFYSSDRLEIKGFKEVFRTFKMKPEELEQKGALLFEHLISGNPLDDYLPGNKGDEEWIEFPDALNRYDSTSQKWVFGPEAHSIGR